MERSEAQAAADRRYGELKAKGWSRDRIRDALIEDGYTRDQADCIVDGFPLEAEASHDDLPPAAPSAGIREGGEPRSDRSKVAFWAEALGGEANARWLLQDPQVQAAITTGKPSVIHRAFRRRVRAAPPGAPAEALRAVLADSRMFLEPTGGPISLSTLNGIGARLVGRSEPDPRDGTYVATRAFTVLFVPVWPRDRFLVRDAGSSRWLVLGRVPLAPFHRGWRRVVGLLAVVGALVLGVGAWLRGQYADVHLLNELDVPVVVEVGGEQVPLQPHTHAARRLHAGRQSIVTRRASGREIERLDVVVSTSGVLQVYNVLGAGALVESWIQYAERGTSVPAMDPSAEQTFQGGRPWALVPNVAFSFRDPPTTLEVGKKEGVVRRKWLGVSCSGWRQCVERLLFEDRLEEATAVATGVARAQPEDEDALRWAWSRLETTGDDAAVAAFLDDLLRIAPDEVRVHRVVQDHARSRGETASLLPRYEAAWRADPDALGRAYLYLRLLPADEARPVLEAALARVPCDPWLAHSEAWRLSAAGDYEKAMPEIEAALTMLGWEIGRAHQLAWAQACLGRLPAAIVTLERALEPLTRNAGCLLLSDLHGAAGNAIALHEAIRARLGADAVGHPLEHYVGAFTTEGAGAAVTTAWLRARSRGPDVDPGDLTAMGATEEPVRRFCQLTLFSRRDVHAAAELFLSSEAAIAFPLDSEAVVAIACELQRLGEGEKAAALLTGAPVGQGGGLGRADLEALPALPRDLDDLGPQVGAVVLFAASRASSDPDEAERLRARARRLDPLAIFLPPE